MRKIEYSVGTKDYRTICLTLNEAKAQASLNPRYTIETRVVEVGETRDANLERARKIKFPLKPFKPMFK